MPPPWRRKVRVRNSKWVYCSMAVGMLLLIVTSDFGPKSAQFENIPTEGGVTRKLLSSGSEAWNPLHNEPGYKGPLGAVGMILWIPLTIWIFLGVAIVADEYFTPSLEKIAEKLDLTAEVAGATFLAAASSAPEFFTSFADTFLVSEEGGAGFGVGTVMGSAVFNILIICALSCIPAKGSIRRKTPGTDGVMAIKEVYLQHHTENDWEAAVESEIKTEGGLELDWYPLARDSVFYFASIVILAATVASHSPDRIHEQPLVVSGCVLSFETALYIILYAFYILCMKFSSFIEPNSRMLKDRIFKTNESGNFPQYDTKQEIELSPTSPPVTVPGWDSDVPNFGPPPGRNSYPKLPLGSSAVLLAMRCKKAMKLATSPSQSPTKSVSEDSEDDDDTSPFWEATFTPPDSTSEKIYWICAMPFTILFKLTIPAVTRRNVKDNYVVAFIMCILWIAFLSAMMVKTVSWIGGILNRKGIVMGLVVLSAGTSVPDALGSYNEAKRGEGNAAVSNALGSNVFDICIGLGVPWFLFTVIKGYCFRVPKDNIIIPIIILFFVLITFLCILAFTGMKLYATVGKSFVVVYALFVAWVLIADRFDITLS
eukprot:TRINITY_DN7559_c0_g1_i1.p1 TRINITY_DN7559_c0_g1~~TRINITY_DN7559_c0_g1_i1.p1  ORF type:complete len:597 (+),score=86.57 TRINITY_DN7559_c0_g1_i1:69-1859(+)